MEHYAQTRCPMLEVRKCSRRLTFRRECTVLICPKPVCGFHWLGRSLELLHLGQEVKKYHNLELIISCRNADEWGKFYRVIGMLTTSDRIDLTGFFSTTFLKTVANGCETWPRMNGNIGAENACRVMILLASELCQMREVKVIVVITRSISSQAEHIVTTDERRVISTGNKTTTRLISKSWRVYMGRLRKITRQMVVDRRTGSCVRNFPVPVAWKHLDYSLSIRWSWWIVIGSATFLDVFGCACAPRISLIFQEL